MQDQARDDEFLQHVWSGLAATPKALSPKWFYDAEGSRLFEAITQTTEYYPTRTETGLLRELATELSDHVAPGTVLVEFGSGSAIKTRILLDAMPDLGAYVPIDISASALEESAEALRADYPGLTIRPLEADFTGAVALPPGTPAGPRLGFFPGSTIGNFSPDESRAFLARVRTLLGPHADFLVGFDLIKSREILEAAYDDAAGVTAAFDLNLLGRINRELGAGIDVDGFRHESRWNEGLSRVEAHLVSLTDQAFRVCGRDFTVAAGESIHTENAYKFTAEGISRLADQSGWRVKRSWTSADPRFCEALLTST